MSESPERPGVTPAPKPDVEAASFRRGDRVELDERLARYHDCKRGVVHAIHGGAEDTVEVRLDTGVFTCTDPPRLRLVGRLEVAALAPEEGGTL